MLAINKKLPTTALFNKIKLHIAANVFEAFGEVGVKCWVGLVTEREI